MDRQEIEVYLHILLDTLEQKYQLLQQIYAITENQTTIASHTQFDPELFQELRNEKQSRIQQINELDEGFQKTYNRIHIDLDQNKHLLKESIKELQNYIQEITELSIQIRLLEEKNKRYLRGQASEIKQKTKGFKVNPAAAADHYKSMEEQYKKQKVHKESKK